MHRVNCYGDTKAAVRSAGYILMSLLVELQKNKDGDTSLSFLEGTARTARKAIAELQAMIEWCDERASELRRTKSPALATLIDEALAASDALSERETDKFARCSKQLHEALLIALGRD